MIERYIQFNSVKLLRELNDNKATLKALREQYTALDGATAIDYSKDKVSSTPSTDGLERLTIERLILRDKIDMYQRDINRVDKALNLLTTEERNCLAVFFINHSENPVKLLGDMLHLEKTAVYDLRRQALERFERLIFG